jgi:Secretion system C-terminal sorting domain
MKNWSFLSFVFAFCLYAADGRGQSFTVINDTIYYAATPSLERVFDTVSTGSSAVPYTWKVIDCNFPPDWLVTGVSGYCDQDLCWDLNTLWPSGVTENTTPYASGSLAMLDLVLGLGPASTTGCYYVTVRLFNTTIPTDVDTETWYVCYAGSTLDVSAKTVKNEVSVFPNPAGELLNTTFDMHSGICKLEVCDLFGKVLLSQNCTNGNAKISLADIPHGVYFARFFNSEGAIVVTRRFIKN